MATIDDDWGPPPEPRPRPSRLKSLVLAVAVTAVGYAVWRSQDLRLTLLWLVGVEVVAVGMMALAMMVARLGEIVIVQLGFGLFALLDRLARLCRRPASKIHSVDEKWT